MNNKIIYCLDCDEKFNNDLEKHRYKIIRGNLGYNKICNKTRLIQKAPFECDYIIFNLTEPACFDSLSWGADFENDNFRCSIVGKTNEELIVKRAIRIYEKYVPRYKLIKDSQIDKSKSIFDLYDLRNAISLGGIDCIYFLNHEFMFHSLYSIPDWLGISFSTKITKIINWSISKEVIDIGLIDNFMIRVGFRTPIRYILLNEKYSDIDYFRKNEVKTERINFLINKIGESLGVILQYGKGFIFFLPRFSSHNIEMTDFMMNSVIPDFKERFNEHIKRVKLKKEEVPIEYKKEK